MTDGSRAVDDYINALPEDRRGHMRQIRHILVTAVPGAEEVITYKMPGLRLRGGFFMSYDAFKSHYSVFPATDQMSADLGDELAPHVHGKGTLRFRADQPLPGDLIRRVVEIRLREFVR